MYSGWEPAGTISANMDKPILAVVAVAALVAALVWGRSAQRMQRVWQRIEDDLGHDADATVLARSHYRKELHTVTLYAVIAVAAAIAAVWDIREADFFFAFILVPAVARDGGGRASPADDPGRHRSRRPLRIPRRGRVRDPAGGEGDYARAAELVNYKDVRWVSVQHEYGIFGGDDGAYILDFLGALRVPADGHPAHRARATRPNRSGRSCSRWPRRAALVVMSEVAADLLASAYDCSGRSVHIIPHGIPDMVPRDPSSLKARFGVAGQRMLLTFGLLGPNKGIETVIRALPALIAACPDLVYFVVGRHPPGGGPPARRGLPHTLEREAEKLGVRDHVVFRDQYVTTDELCSYLQAADVFVSPYLNEAQVTSGALSYAMGAGAAVVSTPYWHAQELLADGRGVLFPFGDSARAGRARSISLLRHAAELARVRGAAYAYTRPFTWPRIGEAYLELARRCMDERPAPAPCAGAAASSLPELRLDHLVRMTDDTGIIQHATFSVPARRAATASTTTPAR